ncbi:hypothetical protein DY000_02011302 [Brassica cretica]|uniref:TFIIS central domain-containing protein n=1 Tax=Brassica cretica TaxID=69181 RepID=A0ABQ7D505_BRACR|nr:hypothetical protein DY000_02011302 [Brassica cretica]
MIGSLQPETAMTVRNRLEKPERSLNRGRSRSDLLINDKEQNITSPDSNSLEGPRKKKIDTEMKQRALKSVMHVLRSVTGFETKADLSEEKVKAKLTS